MRRQRTQRGTLNKYKTSLPIDSRKQEIALAMVGEENIPVLPEEVARLLHGPLDAEEARPEGAGIQVTTSRADGKSITSSSSSSSSSSGRWRTLSKRNGQNQS